MIPEPFYKDQIVINTKDVCVHPRSYVPEGSAMIVKSTRFCNSVLYEAEGFDKCGLITCFGDKCIGQIIRVLVPNGISEICWCHFRKVNTGELIEFKKTIK